MARITVEDCLENIPNRFALVMLVAKRAKELLKGAPMVVKNKDNKYVVSALREVATGRVRYEGQTAETMMIHEIESDLKREGKP
jgi:DNA-directed RNA polymerase subunit omega